MVSLSLRQIEATIVRAAPEQQRKLLARLPHLLRLPSSDLALVKLAESAFDFWDNPDDAVSEHSQISAGVRAVDGAR
jgi:hypothetical protein